MKILDAKFVQDFIKMANDGFLQGWHERNGGNLSYRLKPEEVELIRPRLNESGEWTEIGTEVPGLAGEFFLVTGSGKYFRNIIVDPEVCLAIIEIDYTGTKYRIRWGLVEGGRPTSELPTHLMNHEVKKRITNGKHRVIYHAHTTNTIALTFVLPLDDQVFTRELWESATECPVVFPDGVGVVGWMVPGGRAIAEKTAELMEKYDVAIWAHHGMFCSGEDFDLTFGLMHTVEKSAEILVKILSMTPRKIQTITPENFRDLPNGVKYYGHLTSPNIDLYTYGEVYLDDWTDPETPAVKPLVPENVVILISGQSNFMLAYGACTYIEDSTQQWVTAETSRLLRSYVEHHPDRRMVELQAHPLPIPDKVDSWLVAEVC